MPDGAYVWILIWLLFLVLALLLGRRLLRQGNNHLESRYKVARNLCLLYGILIPLMVVAAFERPDPSWFKRFLSPGCFTVAFGIFFYQFLVTRRKLRATPGFNWEKSKRPTPVFFWQAILILLPVALMAGFGFWAILRERNAVEHEAKQRAEEIIRSLPAEFGRIAAYRLRQFDGPKGGWHSYLENAVIPWPGDKYRRQFLHDTVESQIISNHLATLHAAFPEWQEGPIPLASFSLNTNGELWFSQPIPPCPPAWLTSLNPAQLQTWAALKTAAYANQPLSNYLKAFQLTQPPPPGLVCAKFVLLQAGLPAMSASNAINQLLRFAGRHDDVISESGLPLKTLALAEALKRARECGPNEQLWQGLQSEIAQPTALTPILLDDAGRLVAGDPQLTAAVSAMRILLADEMMQADLAGAVQDSAKLNGSTTTNVWVDAMGQRWFCVLSSSAWQNHTTISNRPVSTIVPMTRVECYPQSVVERGFADALTDAKVSLPGYFSISMELEGKQVPLPAPWNKRGGTNPSGEILAEDTFKMSQRAGTRINDSDFEKEQKKALFLSMADSTQEGNDIFFEDLPSHPHFAVQIRLTDRSLLYNRQRQLQWIFGALIAASALAAQIGFAAAYRSFRRELSLNAMKTNFVSSVSHELRAPIASVRLMAENLESGKIPEPEKQREYFRFIGQECRRLSSLIENVLDFSRIEQGRKQYEFEPTDLVALTRTTIQLMEPYAAEKGVLLELIPSSGQSLPNKFELEVDGRAIQQALVNLMDNAIKHSAKGQTVTLEIGPDRESSFSVSVCDYGPGIPKTEQERIFERFYRLGSELRRETQGIGIGLSIVKHIVTAHGGSVTVASAPGQGSRFTISLPAKT